MSNFDIGKNKLKWAPDEFLCNQELQRHQCERKRYPYPESYFKHILEMKINIKKITVANFCSVTLPECFATDESHHMCIREETVCLDWDQVSRWAEYGIIIC